MRSFQSQTTPLIPFNALTGGDTISHFAGHSNRMVWKVFLTDNCLIKDLGTGVLTSTKLKDAEAFVFKLYNVAETRSCDQAHVKLVCKSKSPEALPPTTDVL